MLATASKRWITILALILASSVSTLAETVPLGELDMTKMTTGWGKPQINKSITGGTITIAGRAFQTGVATHAASILHVELDGKTERFQAYVGVDSAPGQRGTVRFKVFADGEVLFDSGLMKGTQPAKRVDVPLSGVKHVILMVTSGGDGVDYDHADWAAAQFITAGAKPKAIDPPLPPAEEKILLTPKPGPAPHINGPKVYGCRPGHPFIYRIFYPYFDIFQIIFMQ